MTLQVSETEPSPQADESGPHHHVLFVRQQLQYKPPTQSYVSQMNSSIEVLIQKYFMHLSMICRLALRQPNKDMM
jgi:hypothetical protein